MGDHETPADLARRLLAALSRSASPPAPHPVASDLRHALQRFLGPASAASSPEPLRSAPRLSASPRESCAGLESAYMVREFVVPRVRCAADLAALSVASPAALAAACLRRLGASERRAAMLDAAVSAFARASLAEVRAIAARPFGAHVWAAPAAGDGTDAWARDDVATMARWACCVAVGGLREGGERDGLVRELALFPFGDGWPRSQALHLACIAGMQHAFSVLAAAPEQLQRERRPPAAAAGGRAPRFARNGAWRSWEPWHTQAASEDPGPRRARMLQGACASGNATLVRMLAAAPTRLGNAEASADDYLALQLACEAGSAEIVRLLVGEPYRIRPRADAVPASPDGDAAQEPEAPAEPGGVDAANAEEIAQAADDGAAAGAAAGAAGGVLFAALPPQAPEVELPQPPAPAALLNALLGLFGIDGTEASGLQKSLRHACVGGHVEVVRILTQEPLLVGKAELAADKGILRDVISNARGDIVRLFAEPPFSVKEDEFNAAAKAAIGWACSRGRADVVRLISRPPFSLARADALQSDALRSACVVGSAAIAEMLAGSPYWLRTEDARRAAEPEPDEPSKQRFTLLQMACAAGFTPLVRVLASHYSLDKADASANGNLALRVACKQGHADVVRELSRPPFNMGQREARADRCKALEQCMFGRCEGCADVLRVLAEPPFSLGHGDALLALDSRRGRRRSAAISQATARVLVQQPYAMTETKDEHDNGWGLLVFDSVDTSPEERRFQHFLDIGNYNRPAPGAS
eukprot:m51a1_g2891 hypothetical protein (759) ;mRNA; f:427718-430047